MITKQKNKEAVLFIVRNQLLSMIRDKETTSSIKDYMQELEDVIFEFEANELADKIEKEEEENIVESGGLIDACLNSLN